MAIYNGTQKVDISGVDKVYVGTQLVYQKVNKQVVSIRVGSWPNDTDDRCFNPVTIGSTSCYGWYQGIGTTFSFPGTIIATYDDASEEDVTNQCTFSGYNMNSETGDLGQGVTVSYTYRGTTVQISNFTFFGQTYYYIYVEVKKIADYITLGGYNTLLYKNDSFVYGGQVTATYKDGTAAVVTSPLEFTGYNMSVAGNYTVNVNYQTKAKWNMGVPQTKTTASVDSTYQLKVSEWIEIWSGSITRTRNASGTAVSTDIVSPSSSQLLAGNNTFRITYSMAGVGSTVSYQENGSTVSTYHSPLSTTINTLNPDSQTTYTIAYVRGGTSSNAYYQVQLRWDYNNLKFYLYDNKSILGSPTDSSATMTVTKIERYIPNA